MSDNILNQVANYYSNKINEFGTTPKGVDWNGEESQFLRFEQLMKLVEKEKNNLSILDYGCGYGGMQEFLLQNFGTNLNYIGFDISKEMIAAAKEKFPTNGEFLFKLKEDFKTDYVVASGVFNVRQDTIIEQWEQYVFKTIHELNSLSNKGFSFNLLTSYSDKELMKEYLYYGNPEEYFRFCKLNFSRNVSLLHDYSLYEFTIIVKK